MVTDAREPKKDDISEPNLQFDRVFEATIPVMIIQAQHRISDLCWNS